MHKLHVVRKGAVQVQRLNTVGPTGRDTWATGALE